MSGLPRGWAWATIGEVTEGASKVDPRADATGVFDYIDISGVDGDAGVIAETQRLLGAEAPSRARQLVAEGDVVLSTVRTYMRKSAVVPEALDGAVASTGFSVLRPTAAIVPRLLYHSVRHPEFVEALSTQQTGSSYPAVRDRDVRAMRISLPPLAEQERIVAAIEEAFSKLDAGEAGLCTARRLLKRMRDAILAAAVTGRLVPQDPTDTPATKLLADLGVEPLDDLGSGLPDSWETVPLWQVAEVRLGRQRSPQRATGPRMRPYLRAANVGWDGLRLDDVKEMSFTEAESETFELMHGDLLLAEASGSPGEVGKPAQFRDEVPGGCCFQNTLIRVRLKPGLNSDYYEHFFRHEARAGRFASGSRGVGIHHLGQKALRDWLVPVPPPEEQGRIVAELERQISFVEACERAVDAGLKRSAALRRSVLKAAFEGRLVPQDPPDEPAAVLLDRIRAERAAAPVAKRRGRQTP